MEDSVNKRIKAVVDEMYSRNVSAAAREMGIKQSTLKSIVAGDAKPSFETIQKILKDDLVGLSAEWLIFGNGEMYSGSAKEISEIPLTEAEAEGIVKTQTRPRIPYTAAAGSLTSSVDGVTEDQCEQIPVITAFPSYDYTMFVKGDSMYPNLEGGDEVACKRIDNTSFIQWGKVHVLDTAQGIVIKRVYDDGGDVKCVSYNKEYPDFTISKEEVYSMSLVVGMLRL